MTTKRQRITIAICLSLLTAGVVAGRYGINRFAESQVRSVLEGVNDGPVDFRRVSVGLRSITIDKVRLNETGEASSEWLTCDQMKMMIPIWDAARGKTHAKQAVFSNPRLRLRFSESGQLLSKLPQSDEPPKLPADAMELEGAEVEIQIGDRKPIIGSEGRLSIRSNGERVSVVGTLPRVLDNQLQVDSNLEMSNLTGTTKLSSAAFVASSDRLKAEPILTTSDSATAEIEGPLFASISQFLAMANWEVDASFDAKFEHELRETGFTIVPELELRLKDVKFDPIQMDMRFESTQGMLTVSDQTASISGLELKVAPTNSANRATLSVNANAQLGDENPFGTADVSFHDFSYRQFSRYLPEPWRAVQAIDATAAGKLQVSFDLPAVDRDSLASAFERVRFSGKANGRVAGIQLARLSMEPADFEFEFAKQEASELPFGIDGQGNVKVAMRNQQLDVASSAVDTLVGESLSQPIRDALKRMDSATGTFSLAATIGGRLTSVISDPWSMDADGRLEVDEVALSNLVDQNELPERLQLSATTLRSNFQLSNGQLELTGLNTSITNQSSTNEREQLADLKGKGSAQLSSAGDLRFDFQLSEVEAGRIIGLTGSSDLAIAGVTNIAGNVEGTIKNANDFSSWKSRGKLASDELKVNGNSVQSVAGTWSIDDRRLVVSELSATWRDHPITASASVELDSPFEFQAKAKTSPIPINALAGNLEWVPTDLPVTGSASADANLQGQLWPLDWKGKGQVDSRDLRVSNRQIGPLAIDVVADTQSAKIDPLNVEILGGKINAALQLPFRLGATPSLSGVFEGISLAALRKPFKIQQPASGRLNGSFEFQMKDLTHPQGQINLKGQRVTFNRVPIDDLQASIQLRDRLANAKLTGTSLGGKIAFDGTFQVPEWEMVPQTVSSAATPTFTTPATPADPRKMVAPSSDVSESILPKSDSKSPAIDSPSILASVRGELKAMDMPIGRILRASNQSDFLKPLDGAADFTLELGANEDSDVIGTGRLRLRDLRWARTSWSPSISADLSVRKNGASIRNLSGSFAEGQLIGQVQLRFDDVVAGQFQLALKNADLKKSLQPFPEVAAAVEGTAIVRMRGNIGRTWAGRMDASMSRGRVFDLAVERAKAPLAWRFYPSRGLLFLQSNRIQANVAGGQIVSNLQSKISKNIDLDMQARLSNVDVRRLIRDLPGASFAGSGSLGGQLQLRARNASDVNDLQGNFSMELAKAQPLQFPVLSEMRRYLGPTPGSTAFETGQIRGRLANGVLLFERITLESSVAQIHIDGTTSLGGKLNLDVVANTGQLGPSDDILRFARSPLMLAAPAPVSLIAEANDFLTNRAIHLHVGGTVRRPAIRLQTGRQIQQEALQFLIRQGTNLSIDR